MKRRTFIRNTGALGLVTLVTPTGILTANTTAEEPDKLAAGFMNPPHAARPHTWWHWMNGNVTREGITLDLEAMARVGLGGFQNFDAGTGIPKGPIEYLSPEWLELKKHAIREAERLGLEFTMHNCPGWSSSGGPWITPELSMQEITWSELVVNEGALMKLYLPQPCTRLGYYKDICVLAYPSVEGEMPAHLFVKRVSTNNAVFPVENITGEGDKRVRITPGQPNAEAYVEFECAPTFDIHQISFVTAAYGENHGPIEVKISDDGKTYQTLTTFNTGGFGGEPRGEVPVSGDVPAFNSKFIRFVCKHERDFSQVRFLGFARPKDWEKRANFTFNRYGTEDLDGILPIKLNDIIDVTSFMQPDGSFQWQAPPGTWTLLRIGHTSSGSLNRSAPDTGIGLECDKYSAEAFEFHFNKMMEHLLPWMDSLGERGKAGLLIDSYEVGMQNWTAGFDSIFNKKAGYNLISYLPSLTGRIVESTETTDRFLWDFRRIQADLMADNYYGKFTELCHAHKLLAYIQPYDRGPMEEMQIGSRIDINVGEFWNNLSSIFQNNRTMRRTVKLSASIAHTRTQKIVAAESFTGEPESSKWQEHPFALKMLGDRMFAQGLNRMVFHRFAHQPHPSARPGMTMGPWGSHFDRTNTWWEQGKVWMDYLARCQYLLQEGNFVADIAYYTGEDPGVYTRVEKSELHPQPPEGVDYDLIHSETLLHDAKVVNQRLVLPHGQSYLMLALQRHRTMSLKILKRIKAFSDEGLLIMGERPVRTPGLSGRDDADFAQLVNDLWDSGKILSGKPIEHILTDKNIVSDFAFTSLSGDAPVRYIHRRSGDIDIYFLANERRTFEQLVCTFRVTRKSPEFWNPVNGKIVPARVYKASASTITVPVQLDPAGSLFVVFRKMSDAKPWVTVEDSKKPILQTVHYQTKRTVYDDVFSNFTISFRVKPENNIMLETNNLMDGQQPWTDFYALYPTAGEKLYGNGHSSFGLAVGRNGVAVWENVNGTPAFFTSIKTSLSGWTHIALVCEDGSPLIYLDGQLVHRGPKSAHIVHPAGGHAFLHEGASFYNGDITSPVVAREALSAEAVKQLALNKPVPWQLPAVRHEGDTLLFFADDSYTMIDESGKRKVVTVSNGPALDLTADWKVSFPPHHGAPDQITLQQLESLHLNEETGVKYFSGTCTYQKDFVLTVRGKKKNRRYFLDLGQVEVIAEVVLNNRAVGTFWTRPFLIDVTNFVIDGNNTLVVKVTTLWPNRLIGDEQTPEPYAYTPGAGGSGFASLSGGAITELPAWYKQGQPKPNDGRIAFATWKHYTKDSPLLASGLMGPVRILVADALAVSA